MVLLIVRLLILNNKTCFDKNNLRAQCLRIPCAWFVSAPNSRALVPNRWRWTTRTHVLVPAPVPWDHHPHVSGDYVPWPYQQSALAWHLMCHHQEHVCQEQRGAREVRRQERGPAQVELEEGDRAHNYHMWISLVESTILSTQDGGNGRTTNCRLAVEFYWQPITS